MSKPNLLSSSLVAACLLLLASGCQFQISNGYNFDYRGETSRKETSGSIDASVQSIEINNKFGDVEVVQATDEGSWSWQGTCWATEKKDADELVSQFDLKVEQNGTRQAWTITLPERSEKLRGMKSNFMMEVPSHVAVAIVNEHGQVSARGLTGSAELKHKHGDVAAIGLAGATTIELRHGQLESRDISGATKINCEHGNITIDGSGESLSIRCKHGNVAITNNNTISEITTDTKHGDTAIEGFGSKIHCHAAHGDVRITVENAEFQSIVADTEHSDVKILLPSTVQPRVDMRVAHGRAETDFPSSEDVDMPRIKVSVEHGDIKISAK